MVFSFLISTLFALLPVSFGKFEQAVAISIDNSGNVFVIDQAKSSYTKFSSKGDSLGVIGSNGWGNLEFDKPKDIWAKNGLDVLIADNNNHRIQRFNRKMNYVATLFTRDDESSLARFGYPVSVAMNSKSDVFVCDGENKRIIKFSNFDKAELTFGGFDGGKGKLISPVQIDIDSTDRVFVLEKNRIVAFDAFGNFLKTIGEGVLESATGFTIFSDDIIVAQGNELIVFSLDGELLGKLPGKDVLSDSSLTIVDIAVWKKSMYILTPHTVYIVVKE